MVDAPKPAPKASSDLRETFIVMRLPPTVFIELCVSSPLDLPLDDPGINRLRLLLQAGKKDSTVCKESGRTPLATLLTAENYFPCRYFLLRLPESCSRPHPIRLSVRCADAVRGSQSISVSSPPLPLAIADEVVE